MKYFCYQGNDRDCGFASLKMMLAYLNKDRNYLYLRKGAKREDYSFKDLIEISHSYNLDLKAYKYDDDNIKIKTPFLAMLDNNHLVLITKVGKRVLVLNDPAVGVVHMRIKTFLKRWNHITLEVQSFIPRKCDNFFDNHITPLKTQSISILLSFISVACAISGFYFVRLDSFVFIPLIFLSLFAIVELVENWYLIKELNFFDRKYIPQFFTHRYRGVNKTYKEYLSFKKDYFSFGRKFLSSFISIGIITFVLIYNNLINVFPVMILLLIVILEKTFLKEKDKNAVISISEMENSLIKDDNENLVDDLIMINQSANGFALHLSLRKCINTFIILIISFLIMIFEDTVSVNFILFHFGVFYLLFNNLEVAVDIGERHKEYKMSVARFLDSCNL